MDNSNLGLIIQENGLEYLGIIQLIELLLLITMMS